MEGISILSLEVIAKFLPDNPIILEAGANIGRDTVKMSRFWPDGHVYAFEPVPHLFEKLKKQTEGQPNITCYQMALGDEVGKRPLFVSEPPFEASSSFYEPLEYLEEHPEAQFRAQEVSVTTIDAWATQHGISILDFLWLDMQGAELQALQGAQEILKTVKVIKTEVNLTQRYQLIPLYADVRTWLEQHGFKVALEALHKGHWGNVLFVREGE